MSYNPVNPNGQASMANSAPVVIASDQSAVPVSVSGGATAAHQTDGTQKTQVVDGAGNVIGSTANALDINIKSGGTASATAADEAAWTAGSSVFAPSGGVYNDAAAALTTGQQGTQRLTPNRAMHTNLRNNAGTELATASAPLRVDPTGTTTQPVSGTVTANAGTNLNTSALALETGGNLATTATNTTGLNATVGTAGSAIPAKGLVVQGSDGTNARALKTDATGNLNVTVQGTPTISGTVTANQGGAPWSDNVTQFGGSAIATGVGASGSGIPRVTVANDSNILSTQSGTWTMQPGNTANTTPWLVSLQPATSGGWLVSSQTALTNSVTAVKASAGQFGGYMFYNPNASVTYIQVFNAAAGSVTLGVTTPTFVIPIPAAAAANIEFANGIAHSTAITVAATTTATGSAAPGTALTGFVIYK